MQLKKWTEYFKEVINIEDREADIAAVGREN